MIVFYCMLHLTRFPQQHETENSSKDQPRQAWGQQPGQSQDQQHHRGGAPEFGRKLWQDGDPYNRQQRQQQPYQQQGPGSVNMTHEQRFEVMQRSNGFGGPFRGAAPFASQQPHGGADAGSQYRPGAWNRPFDGQQQQRDGYNASGSADDDTSALGEGIAVGDDYSRAQLGPSGPQMLFNPRTNSLEPTQPPSKEPASRSLQQRGWGIPSKAKPSSADTVPVAGIAARSILKAPAVAASSRAVHDPKSLREEARYLLPTNQPLPQY